MVKSKRSMIPAMREIINNDLIKEGMVQYSRSANLYEFDNGSTIRFISAEDPDKVVGIESDILYCDEVDGIKYDVFDELDTRTSEKTIVSFNPRGRFRIYDDISLSPGFYEDISTYRDNKYLTTEHINKLLYKASKSVNFKRVYLDGEWGASEGIIFQQDVDWFLIDELPHMSPLITKYGFGMDFGYTNDPSVLVKIYVMKNNIYIDECFYRTKMLNKDIAKELEYFNPDNDIIISESAEPKSIAELKLTYGTNIKPVKKSLIISGIEQLQQLNIFITERSTNIIDEFKNYEWSKTKKDKNGRLQPKDSFNHAIDAIRYYVNMEIKPYTSKIKIVRL